MWIEKEINKITQIYNGTTGSENEQYYIRNCLMFYGMSNEIGNPCYAISYETVMNMMNGKTQNNFIWIEYEQTHELIYVKKEENKNGTV